MRNALVGLSLVVAGATIGWAATTVLTPPADPIDASSFTHVAVQHGEVGASISLTATAKWTPTPAGTNRATGTVTSVAVSAGDEVTQGSVLYRVDQRAVVAAQGEIPAHRAIRPGTEGADVAQVQQMLVDLGHYRGPIDGRSGAGTVTAIRAWQESLEGPITGVIEVEDIIFVPRLPVRAVLDPHTVSRGNLVSGGELVLSVLPDAPVFALPVTEAQASSMPPDAAIEISSPDGSLWSAVITAQTSDEQTGTVSFLLESPEGGAVCGDECHEISTTDETRLGARFITVETTAGLVVPSAALVSTAEKQIVVVLPDGNSAPVKVLASAHGMSVIVGVEEGTRVRVPASIAAEQ